MPPATASAASKPPAAQSGDKKEMKKNEHKGGGEGGKKDAKDKTATQLALQMQAKLMREIRRQKDAPASISTAQLRATIDKIAENDAAWLKNACHWQDSRAFSSFQGKARHLELDLVPLGIPKPGGNGHKKQPNKAPRPVLDWEGLQLRVEDWSARQIAADQVMNNATGLAMTSWPTLRGLAAKVTSPHALALLVPGHFSVRGQEDADIDKLQWAHIDLVVMERLTLQPSTRKATIFQLGDSKVTKVVDTDAGIGIQGDALKEILCVAAFEFLTPSKLKEVKEDSLTFFRQLLKVEEGTPMYGLRSKDTHIEVIIKTKTKIAHDYVFTQKKLNSQGIFVREILRDNSKPDDTSAIIWLKKFDKRSIAIAEAVGPEAFLIWRPGKVGVRFPNSCLAKARKILLPAFLLPSDNALSVKGNISYIVDGLPSGFDPQDVLAKLAARGWPVILGKPLLGPYSLRVLADEPPKDLAVPHGQKPIILRREFPIVVADDEDSMDDDDGGVDDDDVPVVVDPPPLPGSSSSSAVPVFAAGWSAPFPTANDQPSATPIPPATRPSKKSGTGTVNNQAANNVNPPASDARIDKLEAALELINAKQMQMDVQLSLNVEQISTLGTKVDSMQSDSASMLAMMTVMMGKQDALLAQNNAQVQDDRRVRPRASLEGPPSGLE
jgi:hypothetical protein